MTSGFGRLTHPPTPIDGCPAEEAFGRDDPESVPGCYEGEFAVGEEQGREDTWKSQRGRQAFGFTVAWTVR